MASEIGLRRPPSLALIIGIDDYAHCRKLHGAVADAQEMKQYLEEVLQVPSDRIRTLYNKEATRKAILEAFEYLRDEKLKFEKGDHIVVFYAGHGGELTPPASWYVGKQQIQCLIPQDCEAKRVGPGTEETVPIEGHEPIPDRTIGVFLEDMAKRRGDNITVILDCCHSASGTRDGEQEYVPCSVSRDPDGDADAVFFDCPLSREDEYLPRTVDLSTLAIPEDVDSTIWSGRAGVIHNEFAYHGLRSHVLLAACREKEKAYEHEQRGQFTRALLKTLKMCADKKLDLSYAEVLERIHLNKDQHPQCEGRNRHRVIFDTRVTTGRQVWYSAQAGDGKYIIGAGLAHGVAPGVELSIYNEKKLWLGDVSVDETSPITDFQTTVTTPEVIKDVIYAKVTRVGNVPIYIGDHSALAETIQKLEGISINAPKFRVVNEVEEAKLQVTIEGNQATFRILDERARTLGLTELPHKSILDNLAHILPSAAHFFWYLGLENKGNQLGSNREISANLHLLRRIYDDFGTPLFVPVTKPGYRREDPNPSDIIDFVINPTGRYGIEVKNNTKKDFYFNAFLFNISSLSIAVCHTQSSAGNPEAPLKQGGTFCIGYGVGGSAPFSYTLEKDQKVDVSYLKIFLSTCPIDLSDIEQPSPFLGVHPPPMQDKRDANLPNSPPRPRDIWFTVLVPVVQRRAEEVH